MNQIAKSIAKTSDKIPEEIKTGTKTPTERKDVVIDDKVNYIKENSTQLDDEIGEDLDVRSKKKIVAGETYDVSDQCSKDNLNELIEINGSHNFFLFLRIDINTSILFLRKQY